MLDFLRDLTKPAAEKEQERLNAYLDGALSTRERAQVEAELADRPALQEELAHLRQIKAGLQQLPRLRAPRNYTLDPTVYGAPAPQPAFQLYPALRVATALAAFLFIFVLAAGMFAPSGYLSPQFVPGDNVAEAEQYSIEDTDGAAAALPAATAVADVAELEAETAAAAIEEAEEIAAEAADDDMAAAADEAMDADEAGDAANRAEAEAAVAPEPIGTPVADATATTAAKAPTPAPTATASSGRTGESGPSPSPLFLAEVGLGLLFFLLLLTTILVRRQL